jgi:ribonuclease P protein component
LADLEADFSDGLEDLNLAGSAVLLVLALTKVGRAVKRNRAKRETVNCFGNMIHVIAS